MLLSDRLQPCIAADARDGKTRYADDQSWELALGQADQPALALQTRYGGRVGLARLVPMIQLGDQRIYEAGAFAKPFQLTALFPNALQIEAEIIAGVKLKLTCWTMESQAMGGFFQITNNTAQAITGRVELYAQAMRGENETVPMSLVHLNGGEVALTWNNLPDLQPVLLIEQGQETGSARLSAPITLAAGKNATVKFIHAGYTDLEKSLFAAVQWLKQDWLPSLRVISERHKAVPQIDTGDDQLDAAILLSQQSALRSLMSATEHLSHPAPIYVRVPEYGYKPDHLHGWNGQTALDMFQLGTALISLDPMLAKGLVRNYIAVQQSDGWIDAAPGAAGQRSGDLCPPVLAQLAALIDQHTGDQAFVEEVYPALLRFYARWFAPDMDSDGDGFPEWQHDPLPLQADLDMRLVEAPGLATYLLNEGSALESLATGSRKTAWNKVKKAHSRLAEQLQKSWQGGQFIYRDRDLDQPLTGEKLWQGKGDQKMEQPITLKNPNRLVVQAKGGVSHRPKLKATIKGVDYQGKNASEVIEDPAFSWYRSAGAATSHTLWQQIDYVQVDGLSRVYDIALETQDLQQQDITLLLPYATDFINETQAAALLKQIKGSYWGTAGLPSHPQNAEDQRVILPLVSMIGLALLQRGETRTSLELFERITKAQGQSLIQQGSFFAMYHAGTGTGLGQPDHSSGIIPLYWLMNLVGVLVRDPQTVQILGSSAFRRKIQITQHGVKIVRSSKQTQIKFPSGHTVELPASAEPQLITDPTGKPPAKKRTAK